MSESKLLDKYHAKCPFAVLTQVAMRGLIASELDEIFEENRSQQYERTLTFSAMAMAVSDVVLRLVGSFRQAFSAHREELRVSLTSFYNKINATELQISEGIVTRSAERASALQDELGFTPWDVLPGYRVYALDGNHLQESEKRLAPLRQQHDAPLPGTVVARFDLQRQLFDRCYLLEDAHAQESTVSDRVLEDLHPGDVILGDRHYCILDFLRGINEKGASFLIRQHGRFKGVLVGKRRKIGRTETGMVYEQTIRTSSAADALVMRRITVELDKPTRDGETAIHLLTNLPSDVDARTIADCYRNRWEEENAYYYLTTTLTCELASAGAPQAALFLFSMAMMAFNIRQVVLASLYAVHDEDSVNEISHHAVSVEISRFSDGMLVVLDDEFWRRTVGDTPEELAATMCTFSRNIDLKRYHKTKRGPKKKVIKPPRTRPKTHVSTAKILREASD